MPFQRCVRFAWKKDLADSREETRNFLGSILAVQYFEKGFGKMLAVLYSMYA